MGWYDDAARRLRRALHALLRLHREVDRIIYGTTPVVPGALYSAMMRQGERVAGLLVAETAAVYSTRQRRKGKSWRHKQPESHEFAVFREFDYTPALARDIENARRSIMVMCPFVHWTSQSSWIDLLAKAADRGVEVIVHVRRSEVSHAGYDRLRPYVSARDKQIHQKLVVIDDAVFWIGSANLFCDTGAEELMLRGTLPNVANALLRRAIEVTQ